ncbi:hypothetical protein TNCV_3227831 [Trichonephila clavipes]|nr:hypothetical protein TNCV_3227831 [Trichonephila clavipes]
MEKEAARRKRDKSTLRGQEWRSARKGGLTAPKRVRGAPKRNRNREAAEFFFFSAGMKERMETARRNLQPEQSWK